MSAGQPAARPEAYWAIEQEVSNFRVELLQHAHLAAILTMAPHYHDAELVQDGWRVLARSLDALSDGADERLMQTVEAAIASIPMTGGAR